MFYILNDKTREEISENTLEPTNLQCRTQNLNDG